jgi:hypothetical protein
LHPSVYGAEIKIERAHTHLNTVEGEILRVVGHDAYRTPSHHNPECTKYRFMVEGLQPLSEGLSAIVGDFLHNLRSALDHLAHGIIECGGGTAGQTTIFPLKLKKPGAPLMIRGNPDFPAPQEVVDLQPYTRRKDAAQDLAPTKKPLAILNELNLADKHRRLLFSVVQFRHAWWSEGDKSSPTVFIVHPGPFKDGDELAIVEFDEPHPDFDPNFTLYVKLDERELPSKRMRVTLSQRPLGDTLGLLLNAVENVAVPRLRPLLA